MWFITKKGRMAAAFRSAFGFEHERLREPRYRKEVLIKIALLASETQEAARLCTFTPDSARRARKYQQAFARYDNVFRRIEFFDPAFAARIPHWSELSKFVGDWVRGEAVDDKILHFEPLKERRTLIAM